MTMRTPSAIRKFHGHLRIADILAMDDDSEDDAAGMPSAPTTPAFVPHGADIFEVTLEIEDDASIVVRSMTPRSADSGEVPSTPLSQCSSTTSRIRRKFAWLRTPSPRRGFEFDVEDHRPPPPPPTVMSAREERRVRARLERTRSGMQQALSGLRFISRTTASGGGVALTEGEMWRVVEGRFRSLARDGLLSREDFAECIGMVDSSEFGKKVFDALARRRKQRLVRITVEELREFWVQISDQSFDARLQIFFDMVDTNADGRITREEVQELIVLSASANKLSRLKEQAEEYAALIMEELDPENLGYIELWQLEALLLQRDHYMDYSRPLSAGRSGILIPSPRSGIRRIIRSIHYLLFDNWQRVWLLLLWLVAMSALFTWKFLQYRRRAAFHVLGYCLPVAKGAAETLKLNMALVLLPVCRNTLTYLRSTAARLLVPFDDNINFHKTVAGAIAAGVAVHAGNHLACDFPRLTGAPPEEYATALAGDFGSTKPTFARLVTGIEGVTGIAMVVLMAVSFTLAMSGFRKRGARLPAPLNRLTGFNAFWYSHHLLAVVYVLLLVHGYFVFMVHKWYKKTTWMYISLPLMMYLGERCLRTLRSEVYTVKILKVSVLPGNVLTVVMSKPQGFKYKSGQYMFLKCPSVSPFEWHPFSITSAPGDDHLSVHIRTVGDWTQELRRVFTEPNSSHSAIGRARFSASGVIRHKSLPRLLVDGPYGAPAQDYRNYDVLLLVGLGIGATPFISILRDLLNNLRTEEVQKDSSSTDISQLDDSFNSNITSSTSTGNSSSSSSRGMQRATKAHFYWVTREPGSFEWFKGVMDEVAEMDQRGVIEMHNYLTSVYEEGDARTTLLTMIQALNHAKNGVDIVSGTRVRTHFARPNWNEVFARIASKHPGATVGVFYCGMPILAKELKKLSHELSHSTKTRFHFHKEYL